MMAYERIDANGAIVAKVQTGETMKESDVTHKIMIELKETLDNWKRNSNQENKFDEKPIQITNNIDFIEL